MIDSTKAPMSPTRRYVTTALLTLLILVAMYVLWTKELHHSNPSPASSTPAVTHPAARSATAPTPSTTIPGGIPISGRNPFGG